MFVDDAGIFSVDVGKDDDVHKAVSPADVRIMNNENAPAEPPDDEVPFDDDDAPPDALDAKAIEAALAPVFE